MSLSSRIFSDLICLLFLLIIPIASATVTHYQTNEDGIFYDCIENDNLILKFAYFSSANTTHHHQPEGYYLDQIVIKSTSPQNIIALWQTHRFRYTTDNYATISWKVSQGSASHDITTYSSEHIRVQLSSSGNFNDGSKNVNFGIITRYDVYSDRVELLYQLNVDNGVSCPLGLVFSNLHLPDANLFVAGQLTETKTSWTSWSAHDHRICLSGTPVMAMVKDGAFFGIIVPPAELHTHNFYSYYSTDFSCRGGQNWWEGDGNGFAPCIRFNDGIPSSGNYDYHFVLIADEIPASSDPVLNDLYFLRRIDQLAQDYGYDFTPPGQDAVSPLEQLRANLVPIPNGYDYFTNALASFYYLQWGNIPQAQVYYEAGVLPKKDTECGLYPSDWSQTPDGTIPYAIFKNSLTGILSLYLYDVTGRPEYLNDTTQLASTLREVQLRSALEEIDLMDGDTTWQLLGQGGGSYSLAWSSTEKYYGDKSLALNYDFSDTVWNSYALLNRTDLFNLEPYTDITIAVKGSGDSNAHLRFIFSDPAGVPIHETPPQSLNFSDWRLLYFSLPEEKDFSSVRYLQIKVDDVDNTVASNGTVYLDLLRGKPPTANGLYSWVDSRYEPCGAKNAVLDIVQPARKSSVTSAYAILCLRLYEKTGNPDYLEWGLEAMDYEYNSFQANGIWEGDYTGLDEMVYTAQLVKLSSAIEAYRITSQERFLDMARKYYYYLRDTAYRYEYGPSGKHVYLYTNLSMRTFEGIWCAESSYAYYCRPDLRPLPREFAFKVAEFFANSVIAEVRGNRDANSILYEGAMPEANYLCAVSYGMAEACAELAMIASKYLYGGYLYDIKIGNDTWLWLPPELGTIQVSDEVLEDYFAYQLLNQDSTQIENFMITINSDGSSSSNAVGVSSPSVVILRYLPIKIVPSSSVQVRVQTFSQMEILYELQGTGSVQNYISLLTPSFEYRIEVKTDGDGIIYSEEKKTDSQGNLQFEFDLASTCKVHIEKATAVHSFWVLF
ncbi:hypothetical protein J7M23_12595 [Candidatus Sumerlaeota bacterium]|nr:hypothetical protein [Candidatus Sumerlaeota bacterium]